MSVERKIRRGIPDSEEAPEKKAGLEKYLTKRYLFWGIFIVAATVILVLLVTYNQKVTLLKNIKPSDIAVIEVKNENTGYMFKITQQGHFEQILESITSHKFKKNGFASKGTKPLYTLTLKNKNGIEIDKISFCWYDEVSYGMFNYKTDKTDLCIGYIVGLEARAPYDEEQ